MFPDFIDACGYNGAEDESKVRVLTQFPHSLVPFLEQGKGPRVISHFLVPFLEVRTDSVSVLPDENYVHFLSSKELSCLMAKLGEVPISDLCPEFGVISWFCHFGGRKASFSSPSGCLSGSAA